MGPKIPNNHPLPRAKVRSAPPARLSLVAYSSHLPNTPILTILIIFAGAGHFLLFPFFFSPIPLNFAALRGNPLDCLPKAHHKTCNGDGLYFGENHTRCTKPFFYVSSCENSRSAI